MMLLDYAARLTQARHNNPKRGSLERGAHSDKNAPSGARKSGFRGHSGIFTITYKDISYMSATVFVNLGDTLNPICPGHPRWPGR
jgi:hypothetical protein